MQHLRGGVFVVLAYAIMAAMGAVALPSAVVSRGAALWWCKTYCRTIFALMRPLCGIRFEIRGAPPTHPCIVASNHQSFLDVMLLVHAMPYPRFVMKRSLLWAPVLGYFARRIGCIPIDREKRGSIGDIVGGMRAPADRSGQMIIYPEGTRIAPGRRVPFRSGVVAMHRSTGLPVELAASNAGCFWPAKGVRRTPGLAVLEFLGPALDAPERKELGVIQAAIHKACDRLEAEARGA